MNAVAVLVGSIYGLAAVASAYLVSMVASGLFARAFYRIYARVLIGICSIMMLAPLLQVGLSPSGGHEVAADAGRLPGHGRSGVRRSPFQPRVHENGLPGSPADSLFHVRDACQRDGDHAGPPAHFGVAGWIGPTVVGPGHYGPFLMLLAAMVFHTDYHLKTRDR